MRRPRGTSILLFVLLSAAPPALRPALAKRAGVSCPAARVKVGVRGCAETTAAAAAIRTMRANSRTMGRVYAWMGAPYP